MTVFDGFPERRSGGPFGAFGLMAIAGLKPIVHNLVGTRLTNEEIWRRAVSTPLDQARIGEATVLDGLETGDSVKEQWGAALIVSSVLKVGDITSGVVPPEVAEGVADIAESLPTETVADNRFISLDDAGRAAEILEEAGRAGIVGLGTNRF